MAKVTTRLGGKTVTAQLEAQGNGEFLLVAHGGPVARLTPRGTDRYTIRVDVDGEWIETDRSVHRADAPYVALERHARYNGCL